MLTSFVTPWWRFLTLYTTSALIDRSHVMFFFFRHTLGYERKGRIFCLQRKPRIYSIFSTKLCSSRNKFCFLINEFILLFIATLKGNTLLPESKKIYINTGSFLNITKTRLFKYTENVTTKTWKFSDKSSDIFHISAQNIDSEYSLDNNE